MSRAGIVIGGAIFNKGSPFEEEGQLSAVIALLRKHGVLEIDSASMYDGSEEFIGSRKLGEKWFQINTKTPGGWQPGSSTRENVVRVLKMSLARLQIKRIHVFYLHAPDKDVSLSETLAGINDAYSQGLFEKFGVSNFPSQDLKALYSIAQEQGYVLPTVYQGCYSPVTRKAEEALLPLLRELGISFYAYSPLAGGFLTKSKEQILQGVSRFDRAGYFGKLYETMFYKPAYLEALSSWEAISVAEGVSPAVLAYRWVAHSSALSAQHGDALILGASSLEQLTQSLGGIEDGPLSQDALQQIEAVWESVRHEALLDNFEAAIIQWGTVRP